MREVYRASKAALNMLMRSFAARQAARRVPWCCWRWAGTGPTWAEAPFSLQESVPMLVDLLEAKRGTPGLAYLDRQGRKVPW